MSHVQLHFCLKTLPAAQSKFVDVGLMSGFCWSPWPVSQRCDVYVLNAVMPQPHLFCPDCVSVCDFIVAALTKFDSGHGVAQMSCHRDLDLGLMLQSVIFSKLAQAPPHT